MCEDFNLYRKATELAEIGVWEYNLITGELFWDVTTRIIYDADDTYVPTIKDLMSFYPQIPDVYSIEKRLQTIISSGVFSNCQVQIKTSKRNLKWIECNASAEFIDGNCTKLIGTVYDVTALRSFVDTPELDRKKFYKTFDHSPIGMALVSPTGNWMKVNDSLCKILGYSRDELSDLTFQNITHPDDLDKDMKHLKKMLDGDLIAFSVEKRYINKNGKIIWVLLSTTLVWNNNHAPLYFISQVMDITDRIVKTEKLIKKGHAISKIIRSRKIGTWELHIDVDVFLCDDRCAAILGYSIDDNYPDTISKWLMLVHPEDLMLLQLKLDNCLRNNSDYHCEYRMKHRRGDWIWMESHAEVIEWSAAGAPLMMLGTETDITFRKQIELEQKNAVELISGQNERLINFAHIISHDLRSHAGNFQMLLDLLMQEKEEKEKDVMIDLLKQNANNLSDTITNLNEVVNIQLNGHQQLKPLNLVEQINQTIISLKKNIEKEQASISVYVDPTVTVYYNQDYLASILFNFLSNAIKYKHPARKPEISVLTTIYEDGIILEIKDNGLGIDLERYGKKLFGMYKTFHRHKDARGIGLFITKNKVDSMGGKIEVNSEVGMGTTFKIYILKKKG
jgi:PAS domain S-box-containing protein